MNGIMERETFEKLPVENKLDVLYDVMIKTHERVEKLETKKIYNTCIAAVSGVVGGFLAVIGREFFGRK